MNFDYVSSFKRGGSTPLDKQLRAFKAMGNEDVSDMLQEGGVLEENGDDQNLADLPVAEEEAAPEEEGDSPIQAVVNAMMLADQGDEQAIESLKNLQAMAQEDEEVASILERAAQMYEEMLSEGAGEGEELDPELQRRGGRMKYLATLKCGGKAKKVKKDCGGAKVAKRAFAGGGKACNCPTTLRRRGGRLVEEDCNGNVIKKHYNGGTASYIVGPQGDLEGASYEEKMDRMAKYGAPSTRGIRYNYVPGQVRASSIAVPGKAVANTNTGKYIKNADGLYLPNVTVDVAPTTYGTDIYYEPDTDIYTFPDGSVVRRPSPVPKIPHFPGGEIPVNRPDNTSTIGSSLNGDWGNAIGGVYEIPREGLPLPDDYDPGEWQEIHDQVNGQVRKTWKNTKTGEITRVRPSGNIIPARAQGGRLIPQAKTGHRVSRLEARKWGQAFDNLANAVI